MKKFATKYGYFTEDGSEYVITNPQTPKPWVNVISNGDYGLVVSQVNGGFSWLGNSNLNRLTRWNQDLIMDDWGKYIYIRDEDSKVIWSPTLKPVSLKADYYQCVHGIGYTHITCRNHNIETRFRIFVSSSDNMEIWTLRLRNLSSQKRRLSLFTYLEWLLGAAPDSHREFHKTFIETHFDEKKQLLFANKRLWEIPTQRGHWNTNWPYTAYFFSSAPLIGYEGDKESFIGQYGSLTAPQALKRGRLSGKSGRWNDSIAALHTTVELNSGEEQTIHFFLGAEKDQERISSLTDKMRKRNTVESEFKAMRKGWAELIDKTQVDTPDEALNFMTNHWLKYQTISGRMWARAAYYQQSGAFGFRDQLQDSQLFLYVKPEKTKEQILLHARHQFKAGHVLHWWHPLSEQGLDARMSDDMLWLPFVVIQYLKETNDWDILREKVVFYDDQQEQTILEHCLKSIDLVLSRFNSRGLPLILAGDWNDGLSAVGLDGKGESVWLAQFLYYVLNEIETVLQRTKDTDKLRHYRSRKEELGRAVNEIGWDGHWFWRASRDDGELIGSASSEPERIFLNPQVWAVISGIANEQRQKTAMYEAVKRLECEVGMQLFAPAYQTPDDRIGYLSRYAPGVRENGGVYTHAATWTIWAANRMNDIDLAYRIFKKVNPVYNGMHPDRYQAEPYVMPGNIDGRDSDRYGRGGWTWYTGSAGWFFRVTLDYLIGLQADYDGLRLRPCFPEEWDSVFIKRYFRGVSYRITIQNDKQIGRGGLKIFLENEELPGDMIPVVKKQNEVEVRVLRGIGK